MEITAQTNDVRISTRKVRLVADAIRNMRAEDAIKTLRLTRKRGAQILAKTIKSAIANAVNNNKLQASMLMIHKLEVNEGPFLKRYRPSTRGRIHPYKKRSSHIRVVLKEKGGKK